MSPSDLFPEAGDTVRMVTGGAEVKVGQRIAEGGQGVVYRALLPSGAPVAIKWYRPMVHGAEIRASISALAGRPRPHPAFAWPLDLVVCDRMAGFGYVMPLLAARFRPLARIISAPEPPSFRTAAGIGRRISEAFAALHAGGLCYRDISLGNLLADPGSGEVAIVDNDNVGTDGSAVFVRGTLRFMAPEVLREEAPPSTVSDLHSLAVILFFLLIHGHPLEGSRVEASYSWHSDGHVSETGLALQHFGRAPLFVFDPLDGSNRPLPGDPRLVWWPIYPRFMRDLFVRTFTAGLTDASLGGRVTEGVWRRALIRLGDTVSACVCGASLFWDPDESAKRCWHCGGVVSQPAVLELPGHLVVLAEGAALTSAHLQRDRDYDTVRAVVEPFPGRPGALVIHNFSDATWSVEDPDEGRKQVAPGQRLRVRPLAVDFGGVRGVIRPA
ncbi:MAG TPA: serine/threonine protein kinase [Candidatus Binatia bacterium]|nr:serine/threonine protein kinase [Candidatus Binatia bacterium]